MTDESTSTPSTETTPAPATEPASPQPSANAKRAERRARAEAAIAGSPKPTASPEPEPTAPAATPAAETPAGPAKSKLDAIKEKLATQAQARAAREAEKAKDDRIAKLEEAINKAPSQPTMGEFLAEFDRDPVATLRKHKLDPKKYLDILTKDAISPGSIRAMAEAQDGKSEIEKLREEWKTEREQRIAAEQERAYAAERAAIVEHAKSDESRWGLLSKLPDQLRLFWIMNAYESLAQAGHDYDRELTLDAAEALFEEHHKHTVPPKPEPKPTPSPTEPSQAATRRPAKTLTPDLAAPSGSKRPKTRAERKQALVAELERQRSGAP